MNYHCLIAGLPDLQLDSTKPGSTLAQFRNDVRPQLSPADARLIDLFYTRYDNRNLLRWLADKTAPFHPLGNLQKEELEECLKLLEEDDQPRNPHLPPYFRTFLDEHRQAQTPDMRNPHWENRLTTLYYRWAARCGNKTIAAWFDFNLNLNNILSATASRLHQLPADIIEANDAATTILTSSQRDFGLTGTLDNLDLLQRLADEPDPLQREKNIDQLRWQWLDTRTFFHYFSIERIFAHLLRLDILLRWDELDPTQGAQIFRQLIATLQNSVTASSPQAAS